MGEFEAIAGFNYSAYSFGPYEETELEQLDRYRNLGVQGGLAYTLPLFDEYVEVMASVMGGWSGAIEYERLKGPPTDFIRIKYRELQGPSLALDTRIFWRPYATTDQWGIGPRVGWEGEFLKKDATLYANGYSEEFDPDPNRMDLLTGGISILYQHYQPDYNPSIKILADIVVGAAHFKTLWPDGKYYSLNDLAFQARVLLTVPFSLFKSKKDSDEVLPPPQPRPIPQIPKESPPPPPTPKPPQPPLVEPPEPPEPPLNKDLILNSAKVVPAQGGYDLLVTSNKATSLVVKVGSRNISLTLDPGNNTKPLLTNTQVNALATYVEIRLPVKIIEIDGEAVSSPKLVNGSPIVIPAKEKLAAEDHPDFEDIKAGNIAKVLFCKPKKQFVRKEVNGDVYSYTVHAKVEGLMYIPNLDTAISELFSYGSQFAQLPDVSDYEQLPDGIVRYQQGGAGYALHLGKVSRQQNEYGTGFVIPWENAEESEQPALSVDKPLLLFTVNNGSLMLMPTEYKDIYQVTLEVNQKTNAEKGAGSKPYSAREVENLETTLEAGLRKFFLKHFKNLAVQSHNH